MRYRYKPAGIPLAVRLIFNWSTDSAANTHYPLKCSVREQPQKYTHRLSSLV